MGGHNDAFFGRWRVLDSLRHWMDAHDLIVLLSLVVLVALTTLALVGSVFSAVVWVRQDELDRRVERIEAVLLRDERAEDAIAY
jgi:uncharacterized iron-regulated membrane protein